MISLPLIMFFLLSFFLTIIFAINEAAREAREHHIKNVVEQLEDFIVNNYGIQIPRRLKIKIDADYKIDKHIIYSISRSPYFSAVLFLSFYIIPIHYIIYGIIHIISLLLCFRGVHDSFIYYFRLKLDNTLMKYAKGLWSEGDHIDSGFIDTVFGNSILHRTLCIVTAIICELYLFISI